MEEDRLARRPLDVTERGGDVPVVVGGSLEVREVAAEVTEEDQAADPGVGEEEPGRIPVGPEAPVGGARPVDRVPDRRHGRKDRAEGTLRLRGRRRQRDPLRLQRVAPDGRMAPTPAAERDRRHGRRRALDERVGDREQLVEPRHLDRAGLAQEPPQLADVGQERRGVGCRRAAAAVRPPADQGDHRPGLGQPLDGLEEGPPSAGPDGLDVQRHRRGVGIVADGVEHVLEAEVRLVAEAQEHGQPEPAPAPVLDQVVDEIAALGDEGEPPRAEVGDARQVQPTPGDEEAHAVGPEEPHAARPGRRDHPVLEARAVHAQLREAGRVEDRVAAPPRGQRLDRLDARLAADGDQRDIGGPREIGHRRIRRMALDLAAPAVDGGDASAEAAVEQRPHHHVAPLARGAGRPDEGHGRGLEEPLERHRSGRHASPRCGAGARSDGDSADRRARPRRASTTTAGTCSTSPRTSGSR